MTEVTRAGQWLPCRCPNGCWEVGRPRAFSPGEAWPNALSDSLYLRYTKMKRKVGKAGKLRLSPNEEAFVLKEDYERRRRLRLLQVREQERGIAFQIREDVKQRRNQQLTRLAEELRAEWEEAQSQKIQNLEKLYLASLRHMGEGHQRAKENEPDVDAVARRATERKRKAEMRHKEALKVQKSQKEMLTKQKTRHIKARKEALLVERERSARITRLPAPVPAPFENIEVNRISSLKTNSSTYHHISTFVSRQMDTKQPDAHLAAEEEARRLEELRKQATQQRLVQCEKAHVRGSQAMKKLHLAQNQERLMEELRQLQKEDLARRRQAVAQMPSQLIELPYKRSELKEDWQRELEFAFEDVYSADRKVRGNLILHLEPEPLPSVTDQLKDEELDLSVEQETENPQVPAAEMPCSSDADGPLAVKSQQIPSKILFRRLLNKIRSQKSLWTIKSMSEDESEVLTELSEAENQSTADAGAAASEERTSSEQERVVDSDRLTIESQPLSSDEKPFFCQAGLGKEQATTASPPVTAVAPNSVLLHPQEEAVRVRMSARHKQMMELEEQKQKQLELLEQIEQQKLRLETDCFRAQLEEEKRKKTQQTEVGLAPALCAVISDEDSHRQMIRNYQQQLLQQNRLHKQFVETARKRLLEFQTTLKERYPSLSATSPIPDSVISEPQQRSRTPTPVSEQWDQTPRLKMNRHQPVQPRQNPILDQGHIQVPRRDHFPQVETLGTSDVLAKGPLESQEHLEQLSQVGTHERDTPLVPRDLDSLSTALFYDRPQTLQGAQKAAEVLRATAFHTLDPQQVSSEDTENVSFRPADSPSFLPLVPECSFTSLPVKAAPGKVQEPFPAKSKSAASISQSVINQRHDQTVSAETIRAQWGTLKTLQEQLELQKEVLQARLGAQKELEKQAGFPVFPLGVAGGSSASLASARAESGRSQETSRKRDAAASSGSVDRPRGFSQSVSSQQNSLEFLQEQLSIQRDCLQARREAQEVLFAHRQRELDRSTRFEQAEPCLPYQVAQHPFTSLPFADKQSREIQEQPLPASEKGLLSSQSEISRPEDGPSSFLQQFLPLRYSLKLLQDRLTTQRDLFQARHGAQMELHLHRQRNLGDSKSGPMNFSFPPVVAQHSDGPPAVIETEPRIVQRLYSSEEDIVPSADLTIPTLQDQSLDFPQHSRPRQENLTLQKQSDIQGVILGARQETQELVHKQSELAKGLSSQQVVTSSPPSQATEWERFQGFVTVKSDNTCPLNHFKTSGSQERLLRFSQHMLPLQDMQEHRKWVDTEKDAVRFSPQTQENSSQTGFSSFIPSLAQRSPMSLPSSDSGTTQEPLSMESDSKVTSRHFQVPELQNRLLKISQLIQPQRDNLKALQEKLTTQREAIIQSRQEAHLETVLHEQRGWKDRLSPQWVGVSLPLQAQHSFPSLPSESERTQELCSANSADTVPSSHSEVLSLPERVLGFSHAALPQQGNAQTWIKHLHAQTNSFPSAEKVPEDPVLPRPCSFEEEVSTEHFIQPHHGDLKALQQQLDMQRKAIRSGQEVSSEEISSSSFSSQVVLPVASSEGTLTKSDDTEVSTSHGKLLSLSQPLPPQQDNLTTQLDLETVFPKELLLHKQSNMYKSESAVHALPAFVSRETGCPFIPLPFAEAKSKRISELSLSKNERAAPSSDSVISKLQDRLLCYPQTALTQQDNSSLQKQLDLQREVLQSRQEAQEDLLLQRQTALQQQVQKHQETLKDFFNDSQTRKSTVENDLKMQKMEQLREWLPHILDLTWDDRESISHTEKYSSDGDQLLSAGVSGEALDQELSRRASKPPISKVKCGLDVDQHELSTIQEVDSSTSGRASTPGKRDFYHDRDPLRVSVSREQSFLGSPLARDSSDCRHPPSQENTRLLLEHHDFDEAVKVKEPSIEDHEVLSHAASDEDVCACLGTVTKPGDKAEIQEMSQEPLSSITVSTGSFLSYENTDVSLTDPESSSEQLDHQERESTTSKQEEADPSSSVVPAPQVAPPQQKSLDAHGSLLPAGDRSASDHAHFEQITADDLDFPELEHVFPHLHHQLFKPLEPHVDFDLSSPFGLSQDNRDSYQHSSDSSEKQHANTSSASTVSFTPLRTHLNPLNTKPDQDPDINLANAADQSFVTENAEGSEQAFQQLLPEFSSQESQHADLPSIYSIEARGTCQGVEEQNFPSEMLQNKRKSVHFQASLSSVCSSSDDQLHVQPSTPQDSISSECSVKQLENREERLVFEELSRKAVTMLQSQRLTEGDNTACSILPQLCVPAVTMETSLQPPQSIKMETPRATRSPSQLTQPDPVECSPSFPLQSSIPVWETESGYGIMEEPELTLVSISDISAAETDFANLTLEEGENEANGCFQAETETSDYPVEPELFMGHCTVMAPTATPSSLQEAFVKRKKSFIERSYQRLREIQNKARLPQTKTAKETGMSGSSSHLRGVNTVRVSLPEERRSAQALGHQQALRLHSQSAELKQQREEKAKQEACAHSRARAKEFHKKTLEKLRAKNTC
ncbi:centrosomal protein of 295 kDa isoform X3 [Nannospalax galili]|uniref:centrosomal protein of 295 kDa isoform X3 n=1 Tax=Nannospalax galili TaxID=1026970 RepID=UPI0004ED6E58|nr:centrosomal protein of 295 kDa isoform X3 [Nannospalax galili]